jgi:hypothetical protein
MRKLPLLLMLTLALAGCVSRPYVKSEFGSGFGMGSSGYFPPDKLAMADAQVREKLVAITGDKHAECVVRFDVFSVTVTAFTKRKLSEEQAMPLLKYAEQVKRQHWVSPAPKLRN